MLEVSEYVIPVEMAADVSADDMLHDFTADTSKGYGPVCVVGSFVVVPRLERWQYVGVQSVVGQFV